MKSLSAQFVVVVVVVMKRPKKTKPGTAGQPKLQKGADVRTSIL
jgi:hypothetical protein